jgi:serine/threonine-protein kinase RsbT
MPRASEDVRPLTNTDVVQKHTADNPTADRSAELRFIFRLQGGDFGAAGNISTKIKKILQKIGAKPEAIRRAAIATYEAEMNVAIHARSGEIALTATPDQFRIRIEDEGPGIPNIELAMQPGYSTASDAVREMGFGAGMGLPNMKRCSDALELKSQVGIGTTVDMVFKNV